MKKIAKQHPAPVVIGWLVTMTVAAFYMYEYYLRVMPSAMVHYFTAQFGASIIEIGKIDTAYYWTYVPLQIFVGTVMDIFGVRKPLFLALASCILGCILFSFDNSINWLLLGRALIGFGSAFGFVAVLKAASVWLPKRQFPIAIGISTAMGMIGAIFGKVFTTELMQRIGVRSLLEVTVEASIALMIISYFLVYDRHYSCRKSSARRRFSAMRQTLLTVITKPQIWVIGFVGLFLYLPTQILGLWDIEFLATTRGLPPTTAAHISSMIYWGWIIGGPLVGYISSFMQRKSNLFLIGAVGISICLYLLAYTPISNVPSLMIIMFLLGFFSSTEIIVFDLATQTCGNSHAGTAIAITNMIIMLGGYLQNVVAFLLQSSSTDGIMTAESFQNAFMILPIGLAITIILSFFIQAKRPQTETT